MDALTDGSNEDFRCYAAAASAQALQAFGPAATASPPEAGISYCIPSPVDASGLIRSLKVTAIVSTVLFLGGFILAAALTIYSQSQKSPHTNLLLIAGMGCFVMALFSAFMPTTLEGIRTQKHLRGHVGDFWADSTLMPRVVGIEDAETYNKLKVLADDIAVAILRPESGCLQIEGIRYRYLIYASDVTSLSLHENKRTVLLSYNIGAEHLSLAIIPRGLVPEFKRQALGVNPGLLEAIQRSLKMPVAVAETSNLIIDT